MQRLALIRQRPSIGDCLLLSPLIREIKQANPGSQLTVITDPSYLAGALVTAFEGITGVDQIEKIASMEWTTEQNKRIEPRFHAADREQPFSLTRAEQVFDCNTAFMDFEREHNGKPPYGIAEFWLRHFNFYKDGMSLLPEFAVRPESEREVDAWLSEHNNAGKPLLGIVLRAGDTARDWDFNDLSRTLVDWAYTRGFQPVTIDPFRQLGHRYALACIGRKLDFVAALLKRCDLALTPDTGLLHLAQAVGTKTVALWGIMDPRLRIEGYNTTLVPRRSLGFCTGSDLKRCQCPWKFQQWSCLHRLTLSQIVDGLEDAIAKQYPKRDTDLR